MVLEMMETATQSGGTGIRGRIEGLRISSKTGTAQVTNPKTGFYYEDRHIASFIGIFPTDQPDLIVYVVIDNPKGELYYGSQIAAPVFRELAEKLVGLLGIITDDSHVVEHSGTVTVARSNDVIIETRIPDLVGTPKRLILPLFERKDLQLVLIGEGYVVRQNPEPGTPFKKGMKLILEFE
jgi:cell division protein FtsI (penicillin-binding protein 3)